MTLNKYIEQNYSNNLVKLFKVFRKKNKFNVAISKINLLKCCEILEKHINYRLMFGTLLGIYRDGELIAHDKDVDIALPYTDIDKLVDVLPILESVGFSVIRYDPDLILSLGRAGNYVDLYFFKYNENSKDFCCSQYHLEPLDFTTNNTVSYMGREFPIINNPEKFFTCYYGFNWKTSVKNKQARFRKTKGE